MKLGYYPGCSLEGTAVDYGISVEKMAEALGWDLQEIDDWNCCGASAAHQTSHALSLALPARNLALAEEQGMAEVFAPCAACSHRLIQTNHELAEDKALAAKINGVIDKNYRGGVRVLNLIEALVKFAPDLEDKIKMRFDDLKIACYYGCLLLRQPKVVDFDDPEEPSSMEKIVATLGAEPLEWSFKTECCGAGFTMSNPDAVTGLVAKILEDAKDSGAEFVVVACPMCHANLDLKQAAVAKILGWDDFRLPVIYITQLAGLAVGIDPKVLGLHRHLVPTDSFVKKYAATGASNG